MFLLGNSYGFVFDHLPEEVHSQRMRFLEESSREPDHVRYRQVGQVYPAVGLRSDICTLSLPFFKIIYVGTFGL